MNSQSLSMEPITVEECYDFLKTMKKHKSPGPDGFSVEFYIFLGRLKTLYA
jgi:hypothetical protein